MNFKKYYLVAFFLAFTLNQSSLFSENFNVAPKNAEVPSGATLNGYVIDSETKETLVGATVSIKNTKVGAYTNKSGFFVVKNIPAGKQTVVISFLGYLKQEKEVAFAEEESKKITFSLKSQAVESNTVTVEGERETEKRQINISQVNIPMQQLSQIRIGGEADIFRSLQYLPGVLTSSQISSGLYIRGGSPDQNLVLLDGATIYNPSHLFGFFSTFNPDAIKDVDLIKGGFPAEFGGRLSAVLNLTQKDGNQEHFEGVGSLGLISSRLSLQGPLGNGSYFIGGRRTYLDLIVGLLPEDPENPLPNFHFYDLNVKISQNLSGNDKLFISGFTSADNLTLNGAGVDFSVGIGNRTGSLRWTHIFGDNLFSSLLITGSQYQNGFEATTSGFTSTVQNSITDYSIKANTEWFVTDKLTLKAGYEGINYIFRYLQNFSNVTDSADVITTDNWSHSLYAQSNYQVNDLISLQAGIRSDYLSLKKEASLDPRFAIRYQIQPDIALKASWGIYHQYLHLASLQDFSFFDTWLPTDSSISQGKATHYIFSVETKPWDGYDLNVDFYYKDLANINEINQFATKAKIVNQVLFSGTGTAYGAEVFLQKKIGDFVGWVGYGLGFIYSKFDSINHGNEFRPKYDRRHDFKIVTQYKLSENWTMGTSFVFESGQSYTASTSWFRTSMPDQISSGGMSYPSQRYGLRLPASHQLNMNFNYSTTFFGLPAKLLIDVYNVYSRRDIWFRYYDTSKYIPQLTDVKLLPIIPTIALEVKF